MKHIVSIGATAFVLALASVNESAQSDPQSLSTEQVAAALKGKTCVSKGGAQFTFTSDGHYAYNGKLGFSHSGHYWLGRGAVTVLLDSGLGRDFAISTNEDVLYMEQTAIRCAVIDAQNASLSAPR